MGHLSEAQKTQRRLCVWYRPAVDNYRVRLVALFLASQLHHTQNAIRLVWNSVVRPGSILEMRHFTRFLCGKMASVDLSMEYGFFIKLQCLKWAKLGHTEIVMAVPCLEPCQNKQCFTRHKKVHCNFVVWQILLKNTNRNTLKGMVHPKYIKRCIYIYIYIYFFFFVVSKLARWRRRLLFFRWMR